MISVMLYFGHCFFELLIAAQAAPHLTPLEVKKPAFPHGMLWQFGESPRTGTFVASPEPELRTSGDIPQWTDRYWISDGLSRAPCASMNFTLVISTRSHDSSPARSTQMVQEKVHYVPFTRKF